MKNTNKKIKSIAQIAALILSGLAVPGTTLLCQSKCDPPDIHPDHPDHNSNEHCLGQEKEAEFRSHFYKAVKDIYLHGYNNQAGKLYITNQEIEYRIGESNYVNFDKIATTISDPRTSNYPGRVNQILFTAKNTQNNNDGVIIAGDISYLTAPDPNNIILPTSYYLDTEKYCTNNVPSGCTIVGTASATTNFPPADVDFRAASDIYLEDGFVAEAGCNFHAYIAPQWDAPVWKDDFDYPDMATLKQTWLIYDNASQFHAYEANVSLPQTGTLQIKATKESNGEARGGFLVLRYPMAIGSEPYGRYDVKLKSSRIFHTSGSAWLIRHRYNGASDPFTAIDEIDIYERSSWFIDCPNIWNGAVHQWQYEMTEHQAWGWNTLGDENFQIDDWHEYSFEWEPDEMRWLVDDMVFLRLPVMYDTDRGSYHDLPSLSPAVPTQWTLNFHPDGNNSNPAENIDYPANTPPTMEVDYVQVRKRKD